MQLVEKADVLTSDGKKVGRLDRVVLDPRSRDATAIIVRKGGLLQDKVVPVDLIASAKATLDACREICAACGDECELHAEHHGHCRVFSEACRRCESACERLRTALEVRV